MNPEQQLKQYLEHMVDIRRTMIGDKQSQWPFLCMEHYVLEKGQPFASEALTGEELEHFLSVLKAMPQRAFHQGQCYLNAQMIALHDRTGRLRYAEGYGYGGLLPVQHGWVVMDGKKVIDMTWRTKTAVVGRVWADRILGDFPVTYAYYGRIFTTSPLWRMVKRRMQAGSVIDDPRGRWPLLRGKGWGKRFVTPPPASEATQGQEPEVPNEHDTP